MSGGKDEDKDEGKDESKGKDEDEDDDKVKGKGKDDFYRCPLPLILLLCTGRDFIRMSQSKI